MESILKSIKTKKIPINPAVVISNKPDAKGLAIARKMGINVEVIESKNSRIFEQAENRMHAQQALLSCLLS